MPLAAPRRHPMLYSCYFVAASVGVSLVMDMHTRWLLAQRLQQQRLRRR